MKTKEKFMNSGSKYRDYGIRHIINHIDIKEKLYNASRKPCNELENPDRKRSFLGLFIPFLFLFLIFPPRLFNIKRSFLTKEEKNHKTSTNYHKNPTFLYNSSSFFI